MLFRAKKKINRVFPSGSSLLKQGGKQEDKDALRPTPLQAHTSMRAAAIVQTLIYFFSNMHQYSTDFSGVLKQELSMLSERLCSLTFYRPCYALFKAETSLAHAYCNVLCARFCELVGDSNNVVSLEHRIVLRYVYRSVLIDILFRDQSLPQAFAEFASLTLESPGLVDASNDYVFLAWFSSLFLVPQSGERADKRIHEDKADAGPEQPSMLAM